MRIPNSTIVMGLVTCVPFGLAIRDTVLHKDLSSRFDELSSYASSVEREQEYETRMAREESERTEREAVNKFKIDAARKALFGAEPAHLGVMFSGVALGIPTDVAMQRYGMLDTSNASIG